MLLCPELRRERLDLCVEPSERLGGGPIIIEAKLETGSGFGIFQWVRAVFLFFSRIFFPVG